MCSVFCKFVLFCVGCALVGWFVGRFVVVVHWVGWFLFVGMVCWLVGWVGDWSVVFNFFCVFVFARRFGLFICVFGCSRFNFLRSGDVGFGLVFKRCGAGCIVHALYDMFFLFWCLRRHASIYSLRTVLRYVYDSISRCIFFSATFKERALDFGFRLELDATLAVYTFSAVGERLCSKVLKLGQDAQPKYLGSQWNANVSSCHIIYINCTIAVSCSDRDQSVVMQNFRWLHDVYAKK